MCTHSAMDPETHGPTRDRIHDILLLAGEEHTLSLATAIEKVAAPIPAVFLTCRSLTRTGELKRVGPGNYELTEQGRAELEDAGFEWTAHVDRTRDQSTPNREAPQTSSHTHGTRDKTVTASDSPRPDTTPDGCPPQRDETAETTDRGSTDTEPPTSQPTPPATDDEPAADGFEWVATETRRTDDSAT